MSDLRPTIAIVRRHLDRRFGVDWAMQFLLVAALGYVFSPAFGSTFVPLALASTLAAASAAERAHAATLRRVSFFAMPLYGRELARAAAIAPVVSALSVPLGYAAGAAARGHAPSAQLAGAMLIAAVDATLVAVSSVFRDGAAAALYVVLGTVAGFGAAALAFVPVPHAGPFALAAGVGVGFGALRAFGETFARYDPLPD
jgi:hypothetical protein